MSDYNTTDFSNLSTFILLGIPGLEAAHVWISIPFCTMYVIAILGNFTILFIVKMELSLHEPMYYFLCMLAVTNLVLTMSTMPKMLSIFWFNSREIDFSACLTQIYIIHSLVEIESGSLGAMVLDRYVAIRDPLRHSAIQTNPIVAKIGLAMLLHGGMLVLLSVILARQRPYCRAVFSLPTKDAWVKAFWTCVSHLFVILAFYILLVFIFLMQRFGQNVLLHFHILITTMCHSTPFTLNPIIYGVRTKQIWDKMLQLFMHKGV